VNRPDGPGLSPAGGRRSAEHSVVVAAVVLTAVVLAVATAVPSPAAKAGGLLAALAAVTVLGVGMAWVRVVAAAHGRAPGTGAGGGQLAPPPEAPLETPLSADGTQPISPVSRTPGRTPGGGLPGPTIDVE